VPLSPLTGAASSPKLWAYLPLSIKYASCLAEATDKTFKASLARLRFIALVYIGTAIALSTATTIITTSSSDSVKPLVFLLAIFAPLYSSFKIQKHVISFHSNNIAILR
jgi:hypothetical protein